jgi:hypothetical protein
MNFTGVPDHLQGWFDQFWVLRWSAYYFSKWFDFPVSPFRSFVHDVVLIVSGFIIFFWVRGVVRLIKYRRQEREEFQK